MVGTHCATSSLFGRRPWVNHKEEFAPGNASQRSSFISPAHNSAARRRRL
jgi:hypothetical protein